MFSHCTRRDFLTAVAAGAAMPLWARLDDTLLRWPAFATAPRPLALPFDLHDVRLRPGIALDALNVNRRYMMSLEPDRLLHMFRLTAGLPSRAEPYYGWEAPENELRGHFVGHYLSACALMAAQTGDTAVKSRGDLLVAELAKCQQAHGNGYLSAFPTEFFDRLRAGQRVWAPFYTYHKIMAGLLDSYALGGNVQALDMVKGMAAWTRRWAEPLTDEQLQQILNVEHGGMTEVLYNLGALTSDDAYIALGHRFDHERILTPLAASRDELKNVHGNTNVPKIIGAARRYELTGELRSRDIAGYFWDDITGKRSYATGGSTSGEAWRDEPGHLARTLGSHTQETCVTYNMLKLTRHLFGWSPEARYADYYERAYYNGIFGTQHPADGEKLYYTPLAAGFWKLFGTPGHAFWCCHGSGVENFAKLADSVYFHDDRGIWVNLFVPSEVSWRARGLRLVQDTAFPESARTSLLVRAQRPVRMALRVRVPYWASTGGEARLNGRRLDAFAAPSSYLIVDRTWRDGDRLELTMPMTLHTHPMPDDASMQAVMYGPLVLAGKMGTAGITDGNRRAEPTAPRTVPDYKDANPPTPLAITARSSDPSSWIEPVLGRPLEFRTIGQQSVTTLLPLNRMFDERYVVYWKVLL